MIKETFKILPHYLFDEYFLLVNENQIQQQFDGLKEKEISTEAFSFYTSVSAIASSRIEGEQMQMDSYIKHKMFNIGYSKVLTEKPNDLYDAYIYAQQNVLNEINFAKAHCILSKHLLIKSKQGRSRKVDMVVLKHDTLDIQYTAAPANEVKKLCKNFWCDIDFLLKKKLSIAEIFFYASLLHLVFVNIHPFEDGNGRAARLLEKWFIAHKLNRKAWYMQSELYYYQNINSYYKNLNAQGLFYETLDYKKSMPFLLMLTNSLNIN